MSEISLEITGMNTIMVEMAAQALAIHAGLVEVFHNNGGQIKDNAYADAPVGPDSPDHTHMRDALDMEEHETPDMVEVLVGIQDDGDHFYSLFVEHGTYKMAAQPFLFPAGERQAPQIKADLESLR